MTDDGTDATLDLRGVLCPINFVKAKLKLEEMDSGQCLEVYLDEGEPIANVPRSIKDEGHVITRVGKEDGDYYRIVIKKA